MLKNWKKLTESCDLSLSRGALVKFPSKYPFENEVIMMVAEAPNGNGLCLIAITGYKAGINCYQKFPESEISFDIPIPWLIKNWTKWVWPEEIIENVLIHQGLSANDL